MAQSRYYSSAARKTALAQQVDASSATIVVNQVQGFPLTFPFTIIIDRDTIDEEIVECTAVAGSTLTITRGVDGTTPVSHAVGAQVEHGTSARDFRESRQHEAAAADVHDIGATASVVGTDTTQTLTNKTLDSPTINSPTLNNPTLSGVSISGGSVSGASVDATSLSENGVQAATVSGSQTLTNKSMSGTANTFTAIPQSAVTDLVADLASKESVANVDAHKADTTTHGATGAVVGTTNTQTLTNKTLTNPTINDATVSGNVANSATISGGTVDSATVTGGTLGSALNANTQKITGLGTPSAGTDAATKAYVDAAVAGVLDSAPGALDTLNELAAALGDDPDFAATVANSIATRVAKAGDTMTGDLTMSSGSTVTGLPDPSVSSDAVNLNYLNTLYGPLTSASASATAAAASAVEASGYADDASGFAVDAALSASQAAASLGFMPIDGGSATSVYGGQLMTIDGGVA